MGVSVRWRGIHGFYACSMSVYFPLAISVRSVEVDLCDGLDLGDEEEEAQWIHCR